MDASWSAPHCPAGILLAEEACHGCSLVHGLSDDALCCMPGGTAGRAAQNRHPADAPVFCLNRKLWPAKLLRELVNDGNGLYLTTDRNYGDFELQVEYRTVARADSGIYLRGCPQVQIWDWTDPAKENLGAAKGSGGEQSGQQKKPAA